MKRILMLSAAVAAPLAAQAADDAEIRALREELANMRAAYERRIDALEQRLARAEVNGPSAAPVAAVPPPVSAPSGANAFNPNVSLILSGQYGNHSRDPDGYRVTGFHLPSATLDGIKPQRGFSLAESELGISANIDPFFFGAMAFAVHPDDTVSTEEAYVQTTALPHGLTLKAGRWFSGIGYLNEQHAHAWDFIDAPLPYQAFLGGQSKDDGVQLRWLAPTELFFELGTEIGRGASYPGTGRDKNGGGAGALFAHVGGDVGASHSWRAGISRLSTAPKGRQWDDVDAAGAAVANDFSGDSRLWVVDGVWKWAPQNNVSAKNFKLQGEYFRRNENGTVLHDGSAPGDYAAKQSGWYLQGVYQFARYWRVGLRSERLHAGTVDYGANNANLLRPGYSPARNALMLDFSPSEFSRVRVQFAKDKSREGGADNQVFLQYQMSLGAHGAHRF